MRSQLRLSYFQNDSTWSGTIPPSGRVNSGLSTMLHSSPFDGDFVTKTKSPELQRSDQLSSGDPALRWFTRLATDQ